MNLNAASRKVYQLEVDVKEQRAVMGRARNRAFLFMVHKNRSLKLCKGNKVMLH